MFKRTNLTVGALAVVLCLGAGAGLYAQDQQNNAMTGSMAAVAPPQIDWSRRYQLTPLDQKRLQAMGLTKEEVWAAAKAANEADEDVDEVAQMRLRGRTFWQIADELNIPYDSLFKWPAEWQSPEWAEAVKAGSPFWYAHPAAMAAPSGSMNPSGTRRRGRGMRGQGGMSEGTQRVSVPTCPACGMKLSATQTAATPRAVVIAGKTYYCCAGCNMSNSQ